MSYLSDDSWNLGYERRTNTWLPCVMDWLKHKWLFRILSLHELSHWLCKFISILMCHIKQNACTYLFGQQIVGTGFIRRVLGGRKSPSANGIPLFQHGFVDEMNQICNLCLRYTFLFKIAKFSCKSHCMVLIFVFLVSEILYGENDSQKTIIFESYGTLI